MASQVSGQEKCGIFCWSVPTYWFIPFAAGLAQRQDRGWLFKFWGFLFFLKKWQQSARWPAHYCRSHRWDLAIILPEIFRNSEERRRRWRSVQWNVTQAWKPSDRLCCDPPESVADGCARAITGRCWPPANEKQKNPPTGRLLFRHTDLFLFYQLDRQSAQLERIDAEKDVNDLIQVCGLDVPKFQRPTYHQLNWFINIWFKLRQGCWFIFFSSKNRWHSGGDPDCGSSSDVIRKGKTWCGRHFRIIQPRDHQLRRFSSPN